MAERPDLTDTELDGLFQAARDTAPMPSADLIARVIADAEAELEPGVEPAAPRPGILAAVLATIGGWPAAAGLATAAVAGLMIGIATPDTLQDLSGGYFAAAGYQLEDLLPSYGDLLGEG
ncbi:MAG: dihydroorotate dehydrogenase [Rhodobacter sp.]|nr:dihydroorotate dehydrogenase [Rhodobacter sp.]